jgi:transketolase
VQEEGEEGHVQLDPSGSHVIGMHTFDSSAPPKDLFKTFGFTPEKVKTSDDKQ